MVGLYRIMAGNKARKQAKKHLAASARVLRKAVEEGEVYAAVTKLYGGAQCEVMCIDGESRQCIIRNKFRGRGRRENFIAPGTWCLVGLREWQRSTTGKKAVVDLLHVYSSDHKDRLRREVTAPWHIMLSETTVETSDTVSFAEDSTDMVIEPEPPTEGTPLIATDDDMIDVDDI